MGADTWAEEIEGKRKAQLDREQKLHEFEAKRLEEKQDAPARIVASQVAEGKTIPQWAEEHPTSSAALQMAQGALATDPDENGVLQSLVDQGEELGEGSGPDEDLPEVTLVEEDEGEE